MSYKKFEQCRVACLIDLLPEAGRLGNGQLLELLRRRLLDEKGDLLPRHGDLVHEVVHGLDGDATHLHDDVAEVEEADTINEAAYKMGTVTKCLQTEQAQSY